VAEDEALTVSVREHVGMEELTLHVHEDGVHCMFEEDVVHCMGTPIESPDTQETVAVFVPELPEFIDK
jgi:hypothetical protein